MNESEARLWLVKASLSVTAAAFVFFLAAPTLGFPLTFSQATRILEMILPVFLAYLGSASQFVLASSKDAEPEQLNVRSTKLLRVLVRGPVMVFGTVVAISIAAFGFSNRANAQIGTGMSIDVLAGMISAALGLLTVTTSFLAARLFSTTPAEARQRARGGGGGDKE